MINEENWRVSDEFIAFIYAAGLHLFLDKAHEGGLFHSLWLSFCVIIGIFFFAQDWLSRFGGLKQVHSFTSFTFYLKTILDVALVICLCLIILDAIHQMHTYKVFPSPIIEETFYYKIAFFAGVAWFWNFVVIFTIVEADPRIARKNISLFLTTGHVNDELLSLFPKVNARFQKIQGWIGEYAVEVESNTAKFQQDKRTFRYLGRVILDFSRHSIWKHLIVGPVSLVPFTIMCWIGLHLLLLNLLLSLLIYLSVTFSDGKQIISLEWSKHWYWIIAALLVLVWLSSVFRTAYFSGGRCKKVLEIIGYVIFWVFLFLFYLLLNVQTLALLLGIQQIIANLFIFTNLLVSPNQELVPDHS